MKRESILEAVVWSVMVLIWVWVFSLIYLIYVDYQQHKKIAGVSSYTQVSQGGVEARLEAAEPLTSNSQDSVSPADRVIIFPPCSFDAHGKLIENRHCRYATEIETSKCEPSYRLRVQVFVSAEASTPVNAADSSPQMTFQNSKIIHTQTGGKDFVLVADRDNDFAAWLEKHKAQFVTLILLGDCQ